jgi:hypothetical protein
MSFRTTSEEAAGVMYLLQKVRSEIKDKQDEEELLVRELSAIIIKLPSSKKKFFLLALLS